MTDWNKAAVLALLHAQAFCWIATKAPASIEPMALAA